MTISSTQHSTPFPLLSQKLVHVGTCSRGKSGRKIRSHFAISMLRFTDTSHSEEIAFPLLSSRSRAILIPSAGREYAVRSSFPSFFGGFRHFVSARDHEVGHITYAYRIAFTGPVYDAADDDARLFSDFLSKFVVVFRANGFATRGE